MQPAALTQPSRHSPRLGADTSRTHQFVEVRHRDQIRPLQLKLLKHGANDAARGPTTPEWCVSSTTPLHQGQMPSGKPDTTQAQRRPAVAVRPGLRVRSAVGGDRASAGEDEAKIVAGVEGDLG
jgi:hypothetical protein